MVARGDLGVEAGHEKVPLIQKRILRDIKLHAKPAITATQMLDSMIKNRGPLAPRFPTWPTLFSTAPTR